MKTNKIILCSLLFLLSFNPGGLLYGQKADSLGVATIDSLQQTSDTIRAIVPVKAERGNLAQELTQAPDVSGLISFPKIFWSVVFLLLGYFLLKIVTGILNLYAERKPRHKPVVRRILPIVKILVWSMVIYIIISGIFSPPKETVLAFFASVGVAIGFASQDLLKNLFGGLMILFDKPFQIGDKIETGKYYGEVLEIGIRSTRIVTPDDSVVSVPNSEMMNQSISNSNSSANNCQVVAEVYLPHLIDTKRVRQIATEVAQVSKYVYLNKPITVVFFSDKTDERPILKMRLKAYVMDLRDEFSFKSEMTELVLRELKKEGLIQDN
ncbi:MAG: mechanosensitive ion channel [Bacteroidales bacterium]|nr:mechanosensitive ion channel [Bacteroidales bacterium]MDD3431399.1 mechanosensitive ion channel [Bacteroidales bacterium]MDD4360887.1 mechanosensitive ion channel [Bacteroidales bacterium]